MFLSVENWICFSKKVIFQNGNQLSCQEIRSRFSQSTMSFLPSEMFKHMLITCSLVILLYKIYSNTRWESGLDPWLTTLGGQNFVPQGTFGNFWRQFLLVQLRGKGDGATGIGQVEARMLLNIPQCKGWLPTEKNYLPKASILMRLRNHN